ncbi:angiopoietin-4-like isoform X1 [Hypanus sabinus]|uniref:angiopoietin-4-like isoform X1 n=1 Tax=Hypanus sabinus TaxID=79690 RepID=UPI0028C3ABEC|nr:angiopoietin-4-like isoform X1 [Hypanus sabinus]
MRVRALALPLMLAWMLVPGYGAKRRGAARRAHRAQRGHCSFTFLLPGVEACGAAEGRGADPLQRDAATGKADSSAQTLRRLETATGNNTQWLQKLESYLQDSIQLEMVQLQQSVVRNHTVTMLEISSDLLSRTVQQTRRLTDIEAQVLNQTSSMEIRLWENSLFTNKLQKQLIVQTNEISKMQECNRLLERKVFNLEARYRNVSSIKRERELLQQFLAQQVSAVRELELRLQEASSSTSDLQHQQLLLKDNIQHLVTLVSQGKAAAEKKDEKIYRDCAEASASGASVSGIYTIRIENTTEHWKVYCDMETSGGGWTVIQRRFNGSLNFQRNWKEYKLGFGDISAEHWLGNEAIYLLTNQRPHSLRIELRDWDENQAYALYEKFHLSSERQKYRLYLRGYSGTAGEQSSLTAHDVRFSTSDADNDNCRCKCARLLTGGWWFDACGLSNLNGMYYPARNHLRKLNGIKWHYFRSTSYSLRASTMMIRPSDF